MSGQIFRVLRPLSTGHMPGDLIEESYFRAGFVDKLLNVKAIAPAISPPLAILPGWKERSAKLGEIGIVTIEDFLAEDEDKIREVFNYKTTKAIEKWKAELQGYLVAPTAPNERRG